MELDSELQNLGRKYLCKLMCITNQLLHLSFFKRNNLYLELSAKKKNIQRVSVPIWIRAALISAKGNCFAIACFPFNIKQPEIYFAQPFRETQTRLDHLNFFLKFPKDLFWIFFGCTVFLIFFYKTFRIFLVQSAEIHGLMYTYSDIFINQKIILVNSEPKNSENDNPRGKARILIRIFFQIFVEWIRKNLREFDGRNRSSNCRNSAKFTKTHKNSPKFDDIRIRAFRR